MNLLLARNRILAYLVRNPGDRKVTDILTHLNASAYTDDRTLVNLSLRELERHRLVLQTPVPGGGVYWRFREEG